MKLLIAIIPMLLASCDMEKQNAVDLSTPEPWANKAFSEWPQIVLTNEAKFTGHTPLRGASAFLVQDKRGLTYGATARHLLGPNGGVTPEIDSYYLDEVLESWKVHPRTLSDQSLKLGRVIFTEDYAYEESHDWLVMETVFNPLGYPAQPLRMRAEPAEVGETVYLVGVPYDEPASVQNVYKGEVTKREHGNLFRFSIEPAVDLRGFSGAPILDTNGHAIGVLSIGFQPKQVGGKHVEAGGEDIQLVAELLNYDPETEAEEMAQ
ncbi:S1 family peptidase [Persicirhabdus sediminis]|uniref:Trypsin-like peptidase domain-containing protein n=1 Tax=Persicirhabdus sediminis TaxID=454144 RepID=A0A8J7ME17_9BACT|nr:serine protease [Persicirhabdus sediminis]MBK1791277.1 trypsin-like peptidase domain-containing protein [Persicirhabdus sediminis]